MVLHGRDVDRHLLPAELPGDHPQAGERPLLPDGGRGAARRLQGLQAVPPRRLTGIPGVERARRCRGPGHAPHRRRRRRPRRRQRPGRAPRLQRAAPPPPARRRGGRRPIALARAQRAQTARVLIETTDLPFAQVAFGAGFASIRQFNDTVREVFATTPTELRTKAARRPPAGDCVRRGDDRAAPPAGAPALRRRRPARVPRPRAVPGVEEVVGDTYRRTPAFPTALPSSS